MTGNQDDIGVGLGDASRDRADARARDELDADLGARVDLLEVVDELGQVLDAVDVVMRRRGDEGNARRAAALFGDHRGNLVARDLATFARLGALRHLDFDFGGAGEIFRRDAEAARGDLLDAAVFRVAIFHRGEPAAVLATFA